MALVYLFQVTKQAYRPHLIDHNQSNLLSEERSGCIWNLIKKLSVYQEDCGCSLLCKHVCFFQSGSSVAEDGSTTDKVCYRIIIVRSCRNMYNSIDIYINLSQSHCYEMVGTVDIFIIVRLNGININRQC